jgi:dihydrofolate reductase|tara:strand:+ start:72 stop:578 length:507 start_codon:yes stop_codon:yes gene_type:complete
MINALFAVDHYGGMGINGTLPWPHNSHDLGRFQRLTKNHIVVMGRRTWDDPKMPKPLLGRIVYVVSNRPLVNAVRVHGNIVDEVLRLEQENPTRKIWIIGGPKLIESCVNILDTVYLTHFKGSFKIDTKMELKSFLTGFAPVRAEVAPDFKSTLVKYAPIFKRTKAGS